MAIMYKSVKGGSAVQPTGNAQVGDVLAGKTFSNADGIDKTGTMVNNGAVSQTLSDGQSYTIPEGYHNGNGTVTASALSTIDNVASPSSVTIGKLYIFIGVGSGMTITAGATVIDSKTSAGQVAILCRATASAITINAGSTSSRYYISVE